MTSVVVAVGIDDVTVSVCSCSEDSVLSGPSVSGWLEDSIVFVDEVVADDKYALVRSARLVALLACFFKHVLRRVLLDEDAWCVRAGRVGFGDHGRCDGKPTRQVVCELLGGEPVLLASTGCWSWRDDFNLGSVQYV